MNRREFIKASMVAVADPLGIAMAAGAMTSRIYVGFADKTFDSRICNIEFVDPKFASIPDFAKWMDELNEYINDALRLKHNEMMDQLHNALG